jgi:hypothetical protein
MCSFWAGGISSFPFSTACYAGYSKPNLNPNPNPFPNSNPNPKSLKRDSYELKDDREFN